MSGEAEIAEFDDSVGGDEDVLGFHIAVGYATGVQVVQGADELLGDLADLGLGEGLVVLDYIEELALAQFRDYHELGTRLEGVEQNDDVLVLELLEDLYLFAHTDNVLLLLVPESYQSYFFLIVLMATNCPVPLRRALKTCP